MAVLVRGPHGGTARLDDEVAARIVGDGTRGYSILSESVTEVDPESSQPETTDEEKEPAPTPKRRGRPPKAKN